MERLRVLVEVRHGEVDEERTADRAADRTRPVLLHTSLHHHSLHVLIRLLAKGIVELILAIVSPVSIIHLVIIPLRYERQEALGVVDAFRHPSAYISVHFVLVKPGG